MTDSFKKEISLHLGNKSNSELLGKKEENQSSIQVKRNLRKSVRKKISELDNVKVASK